MSDTLLDAIVRLEKAGKKFLEGWANGEQAFQQLRQVFTKPVSLQEFPRIRLPELELNTEQKPKPYFRRGERW